MKINIFWSAAIGALICASCASVNVQKKIAANVKTEKQPEGGRAVEGVPIENEPLIIKQPVYVPEKTAVTPPKKGLSGVRELVETQVKVPSDYSHAAVIYDYGENWVYEVYCQPLRVTDIRLKPGEKTVDTPFISDSERWMLGAGISYSYDNGLEVQHIYVKPQIANIEATLIVNTNEREYHLIVKSFASVHMPIVRWRYFEMPPTHVFFSDEKKKGLFVNTAPARDAGSDAALADPRFLSFNYIITYSLFSKPRWLPKLAYDDGGKTYITFPEDALQMELPAVFENRADIVNYRVVKNVIIIDKLIENISIKIGKYTVSVKKQKGKP